MRNSLLLISVILLSGCVSVAEKAGRVLDRSALKEKKVASYKAKDMEVLKVRSKEGQEALIISLPDYPMMKLRCSAPNEKGAFFLTSLEYLGGSVNGWNEFSMDIMGEGKFYSGVLEINEEIEKVEITSGRIHRYDTRIVGAEALTGLRNRRERIEAVVNWMISGEDAPADINIKAFENYWKPVLFPELVSKKERPQDWTQEGDIFIRAEDIRWNTSYSERALPELLQPVRNSGTLLRDWEEALSWIFLEYEWSRIVQILSKETQLK